jgi:hypothetical protein
MPCRLRPEPCAGVWLGGWRNKNPDGFLFSDFGALPQSPQLPKQGFYEAGVGNYVAGARIHAPAKTPAFWSAAADVLSVVAGPPFLWYYVSA